MAVSSAKDVATLVEDMKKPDFKFCLSSSEVSLYKRTYNNDATMIAGHERAARVKAARAAAAKAASSSDISKSSSSSSLKYDVLQSTCSNRPFSGTPDTPSMDVDDFHFPKKSAKLQTVSTVITPIVTSNSFQPLISDTLDSSKNTVHHEKPIIARTPHPPALFMYGISERYTFCKSLAAICKDHHTQGAQKFASSTADSAPAASTTTTSNVTIGDIFKDFFKICQDLTSNELLLSLSDDLNTLKTTPKLLDKIPTIINILQKVFSACQK